MNVQKQAAWIGMDLGGTNIKFGLVLANGTIHLQKKLDSEIPFGYKYVFDKIAGYTRELIHAAGSDFVVKGFGIGVPGLIDIKNQMLVEASNFPGWKNVKIGYELEKRLDFKVSVDNDANLAALGEYKFGAGRGVTEMLMVTLGSGVGSGLILNGAIYHGSRSAAGEFGHTIIQKDGPLCACGRRGCVEAFVGKYGIQRRIKELLVDYPRSILREIEPHNITPEDIYNAAVKGDKTALLLFQEVGESLGVGLGNVANLLNLERVVIGGGISNAGELIFKPARETLAQIAFKTNFETITLVPAHLGENAGLVGSACLAMQISEKF
ncbi:MAG TPA: ROK family protein [bacterium]|nr:ROK family protein [bacterium]HPN42989.1 ROK family protein [bacterium]